MAKERWFIGFVDTDVPWWLRMWTRKGFRHVIMMRYEPKYNLWHFVEWSSKRLFVEMLQGDEATAVWWRVENEGSMLSFETQGITGNIRPRLPLYCVSWAKQLLGLRLPRVITPYQLSCELKRLGADVIFEQQ